MLEALSSEFRAGVPWEDLHTDDLVIITDSLEECTGRRLMGRSHGGEEFEAKRKKDKGHDMWYRPGP